MPELPLDDVRVVDLTYGLAGPLCTRTLADLGADVVKVEPIEGDDARRFGPFAPGRYDLESSALFVYLNLNKRGVTLQLETERGRDILRRLVGKADMLVENFPPGHLDALGVGYETLARLNPKLVMTSITSFGQTGSYRDYEATDLVLYALGGMMYVSGEYDRHPITHAYDQSQRAGGLNAAVASLAALHHQRETGEGQHVDVSIFECVVSEVQLPPGRYAYTGGVETRGPKQRPAFVKGFVKVKNGYVGLNASGRNPWEKFAEFLGVPELLSEKFRTGSNRQKYAEELNELLQNALKDREKEEFWHSAVANSFTFQMVQRPEEAAQSPQLAARSFFVDVPHPRCGTLTLPGDTYGLSETPWHVRRTAPLLGEHNAEIYGGELGFGDLELTRLREGGVI
ncbi:MAG: CoA transferase [Chloroflexi bacterium]|nr:CoA transferase [Chloroflexota bacterium]